VGDRAPEKKTERNASLFERGSLQVFFGEGASFVFEASAVFAFRESITSCSFLD